MDLKTATGSSQSSLPLQLLEGNLLGCPAQHLEHNRHTINNDSELHNHHHSSRYKYMLSTSSVLGTTLKSLYMLPN